MEAVQSPRVPTHARAALWAGLVVCAAWIIAVVVESRHDALAGLGCIVPVSTGLLLALVWALVPILKGILPPRAVWPVASLLLWASDIAGAVLLVRVLI